MIIRKISIQNYLCYYGLIEFDLSDGLNIILGENGEGKTKLFEAVDWLFSGDNRNLDQLVSAKALHEISLNDDLKVQVAISVQQYDEVCHIAKSFIATKTGDNLCNTSNFSIEGIEENKLGERIQVDGKRLLDRVFPVDIRKYSMFKGEAELDIFKNEDALVTLIESFSTAKYYDKYTEKGEMLRKKAEKAVDDATRQDSRSEREVNRLKSEINRIQDKLGKNKVFYDNTETQIRKTEELIQEAEKFVSNAEALDTLNKRIKKINEDIQHASCLIDENYTTSLFDENWILVNFESIHKEFVRKVENSASEKRKLQAEFDKNKGIKEGRKQVAAELINNSIPLPTGVPSKAYMEEMLKDEICKVCNRPAKKGSEAYKFMYQRLEEYLRSQDPDSSEEDTVLFKHDFMHRLTNLCISHEDSLAEIREIKKRIADTFEFNKARKSDIEQLEKKLAQEIEERNNIIGTSSIGAEKLADVLKNYNQWQSDLVDLKNDLFNYGKRQKDLEKELKQANDAKDAIDTKTANTFLIKTREILRDIDVIFRDTKEKKTDEFINLLQDKSNHFLNRINIESFTGSVSFHKREYAGKYVVKVNLIDSDDNIIYKPNQSLLTSMHISILFAISELALKSREENYPMIFDAPISSFGSSKSRQFLNLVYETGNQKILLIKNFIELNEKERKLFIIDEFEKVKRNKAFWIYLKRPFVKDDLKTLSTEVMNL